MQETKSADRRDVPAGEAVQMCRMQNPLIMSWPNGSLSPNSRAHWGKVAKLKRVQRAEWAALAMASRVKAEGEKVHVRLEFVPSDRRPRDLDNLLASVKAGLDGLADAMRVNDNTFRITFDMGEPIKGGACVRVWVS